jgi:hypothetical protein
MKIKFSRASIPTETKIIFAIFSLHLFHDGNYTIETGECLIISGYLGMIAA